MSYDRIVHRRGHRRPEDCTGRALWALGTTVQLARDEGQRMLARQMFERGLPFATELGPRGTALTMLGLRLPRPRTRRSAPAADAAARLAAAARAGDTASERRPTGAGSSRR